MKDDEHFDEQLRAHWGAPRPAPRSLRARVLSATAAPLATRRRWMAITAAAAMLVGGISVGFAVKHHEVSDEEVAWLADTDDEAPDMATYFDLAALDDVD